MNKLLVGLLLAFLALSPAQAQNYSANQGTQITFSAASAAGILTPRFIFCDNTTPTQCLAVNSSGQATVIALPSGTYTVAGTVTANAVQVTSPWTIQGTVTAIPSASPQSVFVNNAIPAGATSTAFSSPVSPSNTPVGAATIATSQITIATGTLIVASRTGVAGTGRQTLKVCNTGTNVAYLGATPISATVGEYLAGVAGACQWYAFTGALYGFASPSAVVSYSEVY
jgi:hypothetical protein